MAYNAPYVHTDLRVRFTYQEDWLRLDRTSGTTPAGGEDTLRVRFDSRGHSDGEYAGESFIIWDSLQRPIRSLRCVSSRQRNSAGDWV